jgi:hypothetical protein
MTIDATMDVSKNTLQMITAPPSPKTAAPKKQQSLPTRLPNQAQPTQGVY